MFHTAALKINGNVNQYVSLLRNENVYANVIVGEGWPMSGNVIHLPRPPSQRPGLDGLGFYVRAGRNDHNTLLELLATGEEGIFGLVIDAQNAARHRELITLERISSSVRRGLKSRQ